MGGTRCIFRDCPVTTTRHPRMHFFKLPIRDAARLAGWLRNCDKEEMLKEPSGRLASRTVCARHFRPECFMNFKMDRLLPRVTPTLCRINRDLALDLESLDESGEALLVKLEPPVLAHLVPPPDFECPLGFHDDGEAELEAWLQQQSKRKERREVAEPKAVGLREKRSQQKQKQGRDHERDEGRDQGKGREQDQEQQQQRVPEIAVPKPAKASQTKQDNQGREATSERMTTEIAEKPPRDNPAEGKKRRTPEEPQPESLMANLPPEEQPLDNPPLEELQTDLELDHGTKQQPKKQKLQDQTWESLKNAKKTEKKVNKMPAEEPPGMEGIDDFWSEGGAETPSECARLEAATQTEEPPEEPPEEPAEEPSREQLLLEHEQLKALSQRLAAENAKLRLQAEQPKSPTPGKAPASGLSKQQLYLGIRKYLGPTMAALVRMEMFGGAEDRPWKKDEQDFAVELLQQGEGVYKHCCDEWRFRLPPLRLARDWLEQKQTEQADEELDL